jgi:hypothetical protein
MREEERRKKLLTRVAIAIAVFVLTPLVIFLIYIIVRPPEPPFEGGHVDGPTISLVHGYQLEQSIGFGLAGIATSALADELLKETEIDSAPHPNDNQYDPHDTFITTLEETSFKRVVSQPAVTYTFNLSLSDGRTYQVYVFVYQDRSQVNRFLAMLIKRTDKINKSNSAYIYYSDDSDLPTLEKWTEGVDAESTIVLREKIQASRF